MRAAMISFACTALVLASPAWADLVIRNKETGAELRLLETPCSHAGTLAVLKPEWRPKFKNLRLTSGRDMHFGCWLEQGEVAVLIFEDGSTGEAQLAAFRDPSI